MEKEKEYIEISGNKWLKNKRLSDFNLLIDNLIEEDNFFRADVIRYLIERIKLAENKLKEYE